MAAECPDCQRTFHYITELQLRRAVVALEHCPTCRFNLRLEPFVTAQVYEQFKRRPRVFHVDDPRHPEYAKTHAA